MRKQHHRLNRLMEGILKCDRVLRIDKEMGGPSDFMQSKYTRIRSRLYESYCNQLQSMVQNISSHAAAR